MVKIQQVLFLSALPLVQCMETQGRPEGSEMPQQMHPQQHQEIQFEFDCKRLERRSVGIKKLVAKTWFYGFTLNGNLRSRPYTDFQTFAKKIAATVTDRNDNNFKPNVAVRALKKVSNMKKTSGETFAFIEQAVQDGFPLENAKSKAKHLFRKQDLTFATGRCESMKKWYENHESPEVKKLFRLHLLALDQWDNVFVQVKKDADANAKGNPKQLADGMQEVLAFVEQEKSHGPDEAADIKKAPAKKSTKKGLIKKIFLKVIRALKSGAQSAMKQIRRVILKFFNKMFSASMRNQFTMAALKAQMDHSKKKEMQTIYFKIVQFAYKNQMAKAPHDTDRLNEKMNERLASFDVEFAEETALVQSVAEEAAKMGKLTKFFKSFIKLSGTTVVLFFTAMIAHAAGGNKIDVPWFWAGLVLVSSMLLVSIGKIVATMEYTEFVPFM